MTTFAQQPQGSESVATDKVSKAELEQLRTLARNALAEVERLKREQEAANAAIEALKAERDAAVQLQQATKAEREAMQRVIDLADAALKAQQNAMAAQEKALNNALLLIDKYEARITKVEGQRDAANRRGTVLGIVALAAGLLSRL